MNSLLDHAAGVESLAMLSRFRLDFRRCLATRGDELFELADAVLCADGPVRTLAGLSLVPEHRRGHGALYDAVHIEVVPQQHDDPVGQLPVPWRSADPGSSIPRPRRRRARSPAARRSGRSSRAVAAGTRSPRWCTAPGTCRPPGRGPGPASTAGLPTRRPAARPPALHPAPPAAAHPAGTAPPARGRPARPGPRPARPAATAAPTAR